MKDYEILKKINRIDKNNVFIDYIIGRIQDDNYRGVQCSQHNRLTFDYCDTLISVIYKIAGDAVFNIHVGDDNGIKQRGAELYYQIVEHLNNIGKKGTINSVKKNTFVDLARAGVLERFNKKGNKIEERQAIGENKISKRRSRIYSVVLSKLGIKFAQASSPFEKIRYFTDIVNNLTNNIASDLVEILSTDCRFNSINILEFMYIFSDDRQELDSNFKILLLTAYRTLSEHQKAELTKLLQMYCNPARNFHGNKVLSRDYHNWKNESQQIFALLGNSSYFKVLNDTILLNDGKYGLFTLPPSRSQVAKNKYFDYHKMDKNPNYELHHIIPFHVATSKQDALFIDNERNLIYLHKDKHAEFTSLRNINIQASYNTPIISFLPVNSIENIINVNLSNNEALVSHNRIHEMIDYNKILLKKFYYI